MTKGRKEDFSFRELTTGLVMVIDQQAVRIASQSFEHEQYDNAVLTRGYIDHEARVSFEILCIAEYGPNGEITLRRGNPTVSFKLRYDSFDGIVVLLEDTILPAFQDKIDMIEEGYQVNEDILKARNTTAFDDFRHPQFPDDMLLYFIQDGLQTEGIWCRVEGEENGRPKAKLLNEPNQDFGIHIGEELTFDWINQENKLVGIARTPWIVEH